MLELRSSIMPVTMDQVVAYLRPDEPDYKRAAVQLGADALVHLSSLVQGSDPMLASKAAYLSGLVGGSGSESVLVEAARSRDPIIRIAAAGAVAHVSPNLATPVLLLLLADSNSDVRRIAIQSVSAEITVPVRAALDRL